MAIRILHVVDTLLGMGGMEKVVVNLIQRMDPARFEHVLCVVRSLGILADYVPRDRARVVCLGRNASRFSFQAGALARQIAEVKPDIVHSRNWGAIETVLAGRWVGGCTLVHSEHGMDSAQGEPWRRRSMRRLAFHLADQVLSVSHHLREYHSRSTGFPASRISVIHNGVDTSRYSPRPAERTRLRQDLGLEPEELAIGVVGRLEPVKDIATLLTAAAGLAHSSPRWRILIAGDGSQAGMLHEIVNSRAELRDRVRFLGEIQNVPEFLNVLDVYVLPSLYEGISNSLLEAMALRLPVIASAVGGNLEVVVDGESGLLFPAGDSGELAARLRIVSEQPEERARLAGQALRRIEEHFSIESMVEKYEQLYEGLATRKKLAVPSLQKASL